MTKMHSLFMVAAASFCYSSCSAKGGSGGSTSVYGGSISDPQAGCAAVTIVETGCAITNGILVYRSKALASFITLHNSLPDLC